MRIALNMGYPYLLDSHGAFLYANDYVLRDNMKNRSYFLLTNEQMFDIMIFVILSLFAG